MNFSQIKKNITIYPLLFGIMILSIIVLLLAACQVVLVQPANPAVDTHIDPELRTLIAMHNLTGDPSIGRDIPHIESPVAQLGMKLFFTKALGGDMDSACASCHVPTLGGGDGLSLPIGVGADNPDLVGPGRTHPGGAPNVPRNSPTTFNVAMWDRVLFWDGRIESLGKTPGANGADGLGIRTPDTSFGRADSRAGDDLVAAQSRFPATSEEEMRGFNFEVSNNNHDIRDHLAARLGNYGNGAGELSTNASWRAEFEATFGPADSPETLITEQRIAAALAQYERSQVFVDTPWRAYVQGDDAAISDAAKRGASLFYGPVEAGGANCASCHMGDFFTDEQFHVLAVPQIGPGKGDRLTHEDDFGRFRETRHMDDMYAFRTPSLLNVEVTGPYGHDGAYVTIEGIVRHHLNPAEALATYDFEQLDPTIQTEHCVDNTMEALAKLEQNRLNGLPSIQNVDLTDDDVSDLIAFLHTLTDPCVTDAACLSPWMPDESDTDPDGLRLLAVTQ